MRRMPLWSLALASFAGYLALSHFCPLSPELHRSPLPDLFDFAPSLWAGLAYGLLISLLFVFYWFAYRRVRQQPLSLWAILLVAALFCIPLIATFPYNATDVYRYFISARLLLVYGSSPLATPLDAFPADPFLPLAGEWAGVTSPYGPLWELVAAAMTAIRPQNLQLGLVLFKTLASVLHLAIAGLIWARLGNETSPAERRSRTLLWAWNPALLLTFAVNAHNDALMLFWLVLGWWLVRRHPLRGLLVMALAPLTKPIALLVLPFFYVAALRDATDHRSRIRLLVAGGAGSLMLALFAFLPFTILSGGDGSSLVQLVRRLLFEAGEGGGFSPTSLLVLLVRGVGGYLPVRWVTRGAALLFGVYFLSLLWRAARGRSPTRSAADAFAGYLLQAFKFRIWYAGWPFPWLLLDAQGDQRRLTAGVWFLLVAQLSVLIYNHLLRLVAGLGHVSTHLIGVPFTFLVPFVVTLIQKRGAGHD